MDKPWMRGLALWSGLLGLGACGSTVAPVAAEGDDGGAVCEQAGAHVAACFGEEPQAPTSCNVEQAEFILDATCDQLTADLGKADAWWCAWNPWLAGCGDDDGGSDDVVEDDGAIVGRIDFSYDNLGWSVSSVSCALVVAYDEQGMEAGRTHTSTSGGYRMDGLAAGDYSVVVYDRLGEGVDNVPITLTEEPATTEVTLSPSGTAEADFLLPNHIDGSEGGLIISDAPRSEEHLDRCAHVEQTVQLQDTCGQELAPYYDVRRDWVVTLTDDETGEVIDHTTVWCQPADGDHWSWDGCGNGGPDADVNLVSFGKVLPGNYRVDYYRIDLPDRNNLDYEDELSWRSHEQSPDARSFSFTTRSDDGTLLVDALVGETTLVDPWSDCD